jgi:energy-coupling factor transport system permease protein
MQSTNLTLYAEGTSWLHSRHPFSKLAYILLIGVAAYCAPVGLGPKGAILGLNVLLAAWSGILCRVWNLSWRVLLPLALFMFPIHGLYFPDNQTAIFSFQGISLYAEGLQFAETILLQLTTVLSASLLFVFTTHPADFISALSQAGWPPFAAYLMGSPLLMLPAMKARTATIQAAQRARGLDSEGGIMRRIRSLPPLVAPLVLGAFSEIEHRAIALELRGFSARGPKTSLREVPDSRLQRAIRRLMLAVSLGLVVHALAT